MENYSFSLKDFRFDFEKDILGKVFVLSGLRVRNTAKSLKIR